jgi:hypothetical protein
MISCSTNNEHSRVEPNLKTPETNIDSNKTDIKTPETNIQTNTDKFITERLPEEFTELPKEIIADLEKRKCRIPQIWTLDNKKTNVIEGEFKKKGQKDAAVLCFDGSTNSILIYWNKELKDISKIGEMESLRDRLIEIANAKYIYQHAEWYDGPKPPKINHHGINDIYPEKASTVHYLHKGKWLELHGAD